MVTHCGGHPSQKRRNLHARQNVPVDIIYEEQHVLVLFVTEVLGHGQTGEADAGANARGLIHLAEDQHSAGQHTRVLHLMPKVIAFP